jgi:hypothetical protein
MDKLAPIIGIVPVLVLAGTVSAESPEPAKVAASACTYTVSAPGPSTVFNTGTAGTIQWFKSGICSDSVDLDLWREGARVTTISNNEINNGIFSWVVQGYLRTALDYQVRIRDRDDLSSDGYSAEFTILNSQYCGYRIDEPAEGAVWTIDTVETIRWSHAGTCTSPVDLHLLYNGSQVVEIATGISDVGSTTWRVPDELSPVGGYSVRIRDSNDRNSYDQSGRFSIVEGEPPCTYQVTAPGEGDEWNMGEEETVTWNRDGGCGSQVDLDLLLSGESVAVLFDGLSDSGSYDWTIPTDLTASDDYAIRVRDHQDESVFDVSDTFAITEPLPTERVYWIEAAARLSGQAGSLWRTDLVIKNLSDLDADVNVRLRGSGGGSLDSVISAGGQGAFEDVLGLMDKDGKGWLEITSSQPILASARIYNVSETGTFGQYVEGYPEGGGLQEGDTGFLLQLRQSENDYRTNLIFTNPTADDAAVEVTLYDAEGSSLTSYRLDLDPRSLLQDIEPFEQRAGRPNLGWGFAEVDVVEGSSMLISASVVDSRTNDATTVLVKREGD